MIRIERVIDILPAGFETLRAEARREGHTMIETLAAGWAAGTLRFNQPGEALFAAHVGTALAGIGGLTQEPAIPGALRMRRFYVRAGYRRSGVGRALVGELLRRTARPITANAASGSEAFWEAFGFTPDRRDGRTHILR
jgi:GNAT superfamily N-acetyltransferase